MIPKGNRSEERQRIGAETEYAAMRDEILTRLRIRHQVVAVTLAVSGAFLGVGITNPAVALVYPPLAALLALAWGQNDHRIRDIARYVRDEVEPLLPAVGWESHIEARRSGTGVGSWRFVVVAHGGLFLITQLMAMLMGLIWEPTAPQEHSPSRTLVCTLAVFDVLALGVVAWVLLQANRRTH
jgi:hypothetical protein